jgi:hypothetical protein
LVVATTIAMSFVQAALHSRRFQQNAVALQQAEYLCEAAAMRAQQRMRENRDYIGELWTPNLPSATTKEVRIAIDCKSARDGSQIDCHVVCQLSDRDTRVITIQRTHHYLLKPNFPNSEKE